MKIIALDKIHIFIVVIAGMCIHMNTSYVAYICIYHMFYKIQYSGFLNLSSLVNIGHLQ
jgi:hypothetical protein